MQQKKKKKEKKEKNEDDEWKVVLPISRANSMTSDKFDWRQSVEDD